jgi:hypothetical protein
MNNLFDVLHRLVDAAGSHFRDDAELAHAIISEANPDKPAPPPDPEAEMAALKAEVARLSALAPAAPEAGSAEAQ